ncbi:uncharacterized protein LOC119830749 isoform X2 [Zerene cesonia]|uniref:uncharacterized protein LOC119830749 isoform X2 n=1 Tax=Zerene cesonia TaxID=33412 RepID=UPI0018E4F737|nr:uncharacterized protein LOC119830749 isoform X2 [Zerene cesonia]
MNERKTLFFIFFLIIYCLYNVNMWFMANNPVEETKIVAVDNPPKIKASTSVEKLSNRNPIPLFFRDACSILDIFTKPPLVYKEKKIKLPTKQKMDKNNNTISMIGITVFLVLLVLNAAFDAFKEKEERKKKLNTEGRRQSLAEFANKPLRRESSKFGFQLFQIAETEKTGSDDKESRRRPYTRGESINSYLSDKKPQTETAPPSIGDSNEPRLVKRQSIAKLIDNKLEWLPQRPVYNYHHCEFRFWRNAAIRTIPYSLWNHMFRDQQTRSLNIGCLHLTNSGDTSNGAYIKILDNKRKHEVTIKTPYDYETILTGDNQTPPSLFELSKRRFYIILCDIANKLNDRPVSIYSDNHRDNVNNICVRKLEDKLDGFRINEHSQINDINGNYELNRRNQLNYIIRNRTRTYAPADIVRGYFDYLPNFIKTDLCNGPPSRCENITCKNPVFDYAYFDFCIEKIILIDSKEDVLLSAVFCSKLCADSWKSEKPALQWKLV